MRSGAGGVQSLEDFGILLLERHLTGRKRLLRSVNMALHASIDLAHSLFESSSFFACVSLMKLDNVFALAPYSTGEFCDRIKLKLQLPLYLFVPQLLFGGHLLGDFFVASNLLPLRLSACLRDCFKPFFVLLPVFVLRMLFLNLLLLVENFV